jgi:hypothetical protein
LSSNRSSSLSNLVLCWSWRWRLLEQVTIRMTDDVKGKTSPTTLCTICEYIDSGIHTMDIPKWYVLSRIHSIHMWWCHRTEGIWYRYGTGTCSILFAMKPMIRIFSKNPRYYSKHVTPSYYHQLHCVVMKQNNLNSYENKIFSSAISRPYHCWK